MTIEILGITENTIEHHMKGAFKKLGTNSRVTVIIKALHMGQINP